MKRRLLASVTAASLLLSGCSLSDVIGPVVSASALLVAGRPVAGAVALDPSKLTAANSYAASVFDSATMAFESGKIPRSEDQDTARPNFCEMVIAELAAITDEGGRAQALRCRIDHHLDRARGARDAADAVTYAGQLAQADRYTGQLAEMVSISMSRGATP